MRLDEPRGSGRTAATCRAASARVRRGGPRSVPAPLSDLRTEAAEAPTEALNAPVNDVLVDGVTNVVVPDDVVGGVDLAVGVDRDGDGDETVDAT